MKYKKQISKNYRKAVSILLLLYFIASPLLSAFPQKTCAGACTMAMNKNHSAMQMNMTTGSHCPMMMQMTMQSEKHHNTCEAEFDMSKCNMDKKYKSNSNFLITYKYSLDINLPAIALVNSRISDYEIQFFEIRKINVRAKSPPIYLVVGSFLI